MGYVMVHNQCRFDLEVNGALHCTTVGYMVFPPFSFINKLRVKARCMGNINHNLLDDTMSN